MHVDRLRSIFKVILALIVAAAALTFTFGLAQNLRKLGEFWPAAPSTPIFWLLGAVVLFTIVVFVLRLTKLTWFWSITGGASAIVAYSIAVIIVLQILFAVLMGLIHD